MFNVGDRVYYNGKDDSVLVDARGGIVIDKTYSERFWEPRKGNSIILFDDLPQEVKNTCLYIISPPDNRDTISVEYGVILDELGSTDTYKTEQEARESFAISGGISLVSITTRRIT